MLGDEGADATVMRSTPEGTLAALDQVATTTQQYSAFVQRIDPAERLLRAAPRALLIMNGDFDSDQPKHYVLDWLRTARRAYMADPARLQWRVYPVGHTVTPAMEVDAVNWLVHHLTEVEENNTDPVA